MGQNCESAKHGTILEAFFVYDIINNIDKYKKNTNANRQVLFIFYISIYAFHIITGFYNKTDISLGI